MAFTNMKVKLTKDERVHIVCSSAMLFTFMVLTGAMIICIGIFDNAPIFIGIFFIIFLPFWLLICYVIDRLIGDYIT